MPAVRTDSLEVIVSERRVLTVDIMMLVLERRGAPLPAFEAGAHVDVTIGDYVRQYSLCGDPRDRSRYRIAIRRERNSRGGSIAMHGVTVGSSLQISPPSNQFALVPAERVVLIGGGIGITPLLSMAYSLLARGVPFTLHYSVRAAEKVPFEEELHSPPLRDHVVLHRTDSAAGVLFDAERAIPEPASQTHLFVCGPTGFMDLVLETARAKGWQPSNLHKEYFSSAPTKGGSSFWVDAARSKLRVFVGPEQTIADALIDAGVDVPLSCEQGVCGTCLTKVLSGGADHRDVFQTDAEHRRGDRIALCCSRALTEELVIDI